MDRNEAVRHRSRGEAHLYVAVAKADGKISEEERARAPYHARKSQLVMDVLKLNSLIRERIGTDVREILSDPKFDGWTAQRHLQEAIECLKRAKESGDWAVELVGDKNEAELLELAHIDSYVFKESRFLRTIRDRVRELVD
jgi:hypothetical protein